ncbi:MAG TPA: flagellar motor switch protein FliG [Candidatus Acidoferrales bacterium]|nr:flagellar motor switch protein FliG [Candidatus Acidoferrales bacterium]
MSREIARAITYEQLTGRQKAAVLMIALDVESAAHIFKHLDQTEIEKLTVEITNMQGVHSNVINKVMEEYQQLGLAQEYIVKGGIEYAHSVLEKALGSVKAGEIIEKVKELTTIKGFSVLKKAEPKQLANFLQKEHPQTIALILSNLASELAADVLEAFPEELRADVAFRITTLGRVAPSLVGEIENVVDQVAEEVINENSTSSGGARLMAAILNKVGVIQAKFLMGSIEQRDPQAATEVKRLMFMFEDVLYIDDRSVQRILREVDKKDLTLSLKIADEKLKQKIFSNMSERATDMIKEELQFMGPVRLRDVEAAQTRIIEVIRQLEENEEIVIGGRGGPEDVFV